MLKQLNKRTGSARPWATLLGLGLITGLCAMPSFAIDPTSLQTMSGMEGGAFELKQELKLMKYEDATEWESETSLEYEFNPRWALRLEVPYEFGDEEDSVGDVEVRLKHVFNPDSPNGFVVGGTAAMTFPTGEDSSGVGGDLRLRLSQWDLGTSGKHGLHGNLRLQYDTDVESGEHHLLREDEPEERDFRLGAVLGYTYQATDATRLVVDVIGEQLKEDGAEAAMVELGLTHKLGNATTLAIGVGAGLGGDGPDYTAKAGLQFRF